MMPTHEPSDDTIVAPATPPGSGAVSIVRISGARAFGIAGRMTGLCAADHPPRTLRRCTVVDERGGELDSGLAAFFPAPGSYTGDDLVELHLHGSPFAVERAALAACALGARAARPGEFTRRAFLAGKMDLTQAEGVADMIAARSAASAQAALKQLSGGIGRAVGPLRERLLCLLALAEASIDFGDEEGIAPLSDAELNERVLEIDTEVSALLASYECGRRLREGSTVAIAGVANVGKSSLLNRIVGEERAIVAPQPGTTRDYLSAEIDLSGVAVRIFDTAGLRRPRGVVEEEGVRRSLELIESAELTLFVLDGGRRCRPADKQAYAKVASRPHLVVLNKSDLPPADGGALFCGEGRRGVVRVSALTGEGIGDLLAVLRRELVPEGQGSLSAAPLSRLRHIEAARRAQEALRRGAAAASQGLPVEFVAADLRAAADALAELVGQIAPEEVLDAIFSKFCVGK